MLPKQIDPIQLADTKKSLKGELPLSEMDRLKDLIYGNAGTVLIDFKFGRDILKFPYVRGSIKTGFEVICQRCNSPMSLTLNIAVEVSPIRNDEEAELLPKNYDPLLLAGDTVELMPMVEEEILLSIPLVPKHSLNECNVKSSTFVECKDEKDKKNPFDELKKLLRE
ncbi:MAG: DUF177 domain-containing protein [Gammaproteobacteria bacterium]|nr:DUF177 domain-containing protein [Gammaproteobacteria bacterium]